MLLDRVVQTPQLLATSFSQIGDVKNHLNVTLMKDPRAIVTLLQALYCLFVLIS